MTCHNLHPEIFWSLQTILQKQKQKQVRNQILRGKLKHQGLKNTFHIHVLEYTETAAVPWGRSHYTEDVMSSMLITPTAFPHSICLGSNGFDSH